MNARAPKGVEVSAGQPLDLLRAIREIPKAVTRGAPVWTPGEAPPRLPYLRRRALSLLQALRLRVDNKTMSWPSSKWGRGIALDQLAAEAGYSRSSGVRGLRELEALGLVQTELRRPMRSRYTILEDRIVRLAQAHVKARGGRWADVAPAGAVDRAGGIPRWVASRAGNIGCSVDEAWRVMQLVVAAVFGGDARPEEYGGTAKSVLRMWALRGRPEPAQFALDVGVVAAAAARAPGEPWSSLRGRGGGRRRAQHRNLSVLCRPSSFDERLELARAWMATTEQAANDEPAIDGAPQRSAEELQAAHERMVREAEAMLAEHEARGPAASSADVSSSSATSSDTPLGRAAPGPEATAADFAAWQAAVSAVIQARTPGWMTARVFLASAAPVGATAERLTVLVDGDPASLSSELRAAVEAELGRTVVYEGRPPPG